MTDLWICKYINWLSETERAANNHLSSIPGSANYGQHMTAEEVIDFFAPHSSSVDAVTEWVVASGISADRVSLSVNKQVRSKLPNCVEWPCR